jgi:1-acyl-sn-glycerol-3-phosphate acyltransferase
VRSHAPHDIAYGLRVAALASRVWVTAASAWRTTLGLLVLAVGSTVCFALMLLLIPLRVTRIKVCNYYGKTVGYAIMRITGARPVVRHRERLDGSFPAIYVANHTSMLDAFVSIWLCPVGGCGVMKKQVAYMPFFGQLLLLSGHLRIDRADRGKAIAALSSVAALVKKHRLGIWIMPEGTRSKDGRLLPFKLGFVHLAIATGLPIVPVVLHDAHHIWPWGTLRYRPGDFEIDVLDPISTAGWREEDARLRADEVHDVMARALREAQRPLV